MDEAVSVSNGYCAMDHVLTLSDSAVLLLWVNGLLQIPTVHCTQMA